MTNLGTPGRDSSTAFGIDDSGVVIGWAEVASGAQHAAIDFGNNQWVDLNTLLSPGSGVTLTNANAINASGEILANDAAGNTCLVVAAPAPEPGTFFLSLGSAIALLFCVGRYRVAAAPATADSSR